MQRKILLYNFIDINKMYDTISNESIRYLKLGGIVMEKANAKEYLGKVVNVEIDR